jgi:ATP-binding cassette subfamily C (CFTR/MRP) protein 12
MMSEILTCMRLIKMYAWEDAFSAAINVLRVGERKFLERSGLLQVPQIY